MEWIQILAYRERLNAQTGKTYFAQEYQSKIEITDSLSLFTKTEDILSLVPEHERYDLHYTNAYCKVPDVDTKPRTFSHQDMIPIDLDGIDLNKSQEYIDIVFAVTKADRSKCPVICSGNGIHIVIILDKPFDERGLQTITPHYKELCKAIDDAMFKSGLSGKADPIRLAPRSTLRMPLTLNMKDKQNPKETYFIERNAGRQDYDIVSMFPIKETEEQSTYSVDTPAMLQGCEFLKHCKQNPNAITEYQWYAMLQILAYVPTIGNQLCHSYSQDYAGYDVDITQNKIDHALGFGKPRTCESIGNIWSGCSSCKFYNKCKTPLQIRSEEFIATQKTGFHFVTYRKDGTASYKPDLDGLLKYFNFVSPFITDSKSRITYTFIDKKWVEVSDLEITGFANKHLVPTSNRQTRNEFLDLVKNSNLRAGTFIGKDNNGFINFANGVLDLRTKELKPHSKDFGFTYCLPYDYDANADCPNFKQMLNNVTLNDVTLQKILMEFIGFAVSGRPNSWIQKVLILTGGGSNGKSTFLDIIRNLVGEECYSALSIASMAKENARYSMYGKLFNISFDEDPKAIIKAGANIFKTISAGDPVEFRRLYSDTISAPINAKLIIACNTLPETNDHTHAIYRRMLIVPFRAKFEGANDNKEIKDDIEKEMSGIYNLVIEGLERLIASKGKFTQSDVVDKALLDYKQESAIYQRFFDDCFEVGTESDIMAVDEIMSEFKLWSERNNEFVNISSIKLMKELKNLNLIPQESCHHWIGNATKRAYKRIKKLNQRF